MGEKRRQTLECCVPERGSPGRGRPEGGGDKIAFRSPELGKGPDRAACSLLSTG